MHTKGSNVNYTQQSFYGIVMTVLCTPLKIKCHQKCFEGERGIGGTVSRRGERNRENMEVDAARRRRCRGERQQ